MELFKLFGTIAINNSDAVKNIDAVTKQAQELSTKMIATGQTISKVGEGITKFGTKLLPLSVAMGALVVQGVKYNAQMETFQMNLTTLLGSSDKAEKLLSDLKKMAATTPFETSDLISATQTMIGFGISANDAQKYLGYLGDISMGNSEKLSGLTLAFAQVQAAGKLTGQDLLQMINQGFNPLKYISEMTGKSIAELKDEMSKGAISAEMVAQAFEYATQEGQPFFNAMENGSKTIEGRISTLKDNFNQLVGKLTESLLPTFEALVEKALEIIEKFDSMDEGQKKLITNIMLFVTALAPALIVIGKFTTGIGGMIQTGGQIVSKIPILITGIQNVGEAFTLAKAGFTALAAEASPLGAALAGITAPMIAIVAVIAVLVAAFLYLWNTNEDFRNNIIGIWNQIKDTFNEFTQGIVDELNRLGFDFKDITEVIKFLWDGLCSFLAPIFTGVFQHIANIFKLVTGIILNVLHIFVSIFTGDWQGVLDGVMGIINTWKTFLYNTFMNIFNTINDLTGGKLGEIVGKFLSAIENIKNTVKNGLDAVKGFFSGLALKLPDFKLPHFKLDGEFSLTPPKVPKISVDWYAKAMDNPMLMTKPTAFGMNANGQIMAGGEKGSEVVSGTNTLMQMISQAVSTQNGDLLEVQTKILEAILSLDDNMGGNMREALAGTSFSVNNREFARLVKAVN